MSSSESTCRICLRIKGKHIIHPTGKCDNAPSILCRRCHHRGHFTADCEEPWPHWEQPTSMEELIPAYLRQRWNITTHTPIESILPRGEGAEQQLHSINEVVVPKDYKELLEFLEKNNIKVETVTKPPRSNCIKAIKTWGVERGLRVVLQGGD